MSVRIVAVLDSVPTAEHGGGGLTALACLVAARKAGHAVSVLALTRPDGALEADFERKKAGLEREGIAVEPVAPERATPPKLLRIGRLACGSADHLFGGSRFRDAVRRRVAQLGPDIVFAYHWDAVSAAFRCNAPRTIALVGDPAHLPYLIRREFLDRQHDAPQRSAVRRAVQKVASRWTAHWLAAHMRELLLGFEVRGAFACHHAAMLAALGVPGCRYFRTPVFSPPLTRVAAPILSPKFRIMHIGHLQGIATLTGIELLLDGVLPSLERRLPKDSFEIHVVGGHAEAIPPKLRRKLDHPSVVLRGQVVPADDEFRAADILLVPTPVELGIRVRIITGFSFGSCIVTHRANAAGIPELAHDRNALIGSTGEQLADHCARIYHDRAHGRNLERGARRTFEDMFSIDTAGLAIWTTALESTRPAQSRSYMGRIAEGRP